MSTIKSLIARLESGGGPRRELDRSVLLAAGWEIRPARGLAFLHEDWINPHTAEVNDEAPRVTSSIDAALMLGKDDAEKRGILKTIVENWNELYGLERCILFGCAYVLRARLAAERDELPYLRSQNAVLRDTCDIQRNHIAELESSLAEARKGARTKGTVEVCAQCGYWNEGGRICAVDDCHLRAQHPTPSQGTTPEKEGE